jgi:hypothetical protein
MHRRKEARIKKEFQVEVIKNSIGGDVSLQVKAKDEPLI